MPADVIPPPTPVIIRLLRDLPVLADTVGDRVSIELDRVLPAVRVMKVGDQESVKTWTAAPMFQVEVWAADAIDAERIAWDIANHWTSASRQVVGDALVRGRWLVTYPAPLPADDEDADDTGLARYLITVAFRLSGVPS